MREIKRTVAITVKWPDMLIDELEKMIHSRYNPDGEFSNASDAIRSLTELGIKVFQHKKMMQDPVQAKEFQSKMQDVIENQAVKEWTCTLSESQLNGFLLALEMEKDERHTQTKLNQKITGRNSYINSDGVEMYGRPE